LFKEMSKSKKKRPLMEPFDKHTFFYPGDTIRFIVERVKKKGKK